jgi:hypothetical protein
MFKTLWNSLSSQKSAESRDEPAFDRDKLKMLVDYFPIGTKLRYYPEYQREIIFDTIIIAYRVNDQFIYSRDAGRISRLASPPGSLGWMSCMKDAWCASCAIRTISTRSIPTSP